MICLAGCLGAGDDNAASVFPQDAAIEAQADAASSGGHDAGGPADARPPEAGDGGTGEASDGAGDAAGTAILSVSATSVGFGGVSCGGSATQMLGVANSGSAPLALSANATGAGFSVSPAMLTLQPGASGMLVVTAAVLGSATAGATQSGSLILFANDPAKPMTTVPLSASATGATLVFAPTSLTAVDFPAAPVGVAAPPQTVTLVNQGNAAATFTLSGLDGTPYSLSSGVPGDGGATLAAGQQWPLTASFMQTTQAPASATLTITPTGALCGTSVSTVAFSGQAGIVGSLTQSVTALNFGPAACNGAAPAAQTFTLTNSGAADAHITAATFGGTQGLTFTTDASGKTIPANGSAVVTVSAPAIPAAFSTSPINAQLMLQTDAAPASLSVALQEAPTGAVLALSSPTLSFGSPPEQPVFLSQTEQKTIAVTNTGNAAAGVTLTVLEADGGAAAPPDAGFDATVAPGVESPFAIGSAGDLSRTFQVQAGGSSSQSVLFTPLAGGSTTGQIGLSVDSATPLCAPLPSALSVAGIANGAGPVVSPTVLAFQAPCGAAATQQQSFVVTNLAAATAPLTWSMTNVTGPGAAQYHLTANPPPGTLNPGQSATVIVSAAPAPAGVVDPAALAAQVVINTDVPNDQGHVVSLDEVPTGDQISVSVSNIKFGEIPISTSLSQTFTVTNNANPGSPAANVTLTIGGSGAGAYGPPTALVTNLMPGGGTVTETVTFDPASPIAYPATISLTTSDVSCAALPQPIVLGGTGTEGVAAVSPSVLTFGDGPTGLVNCGQTGRLGQTVTVANTGNQSFNVKGIALGKTSGPLPGSPPPFAFSAPALPINMAIGSVPQTITITPNPIPGPNATLDGGATVDPNDPGAYSDTLTITTDIPPPNDTFTVKLLMQPRGAVIADTPLVTSWNFGTIGFGSIGTITSTITNVGNAPAAVGLAGVAQPGIFGLQTNPTVVPAATSATSTPTSVVGQFTPPSASGIWSDQGTLVVSSPAAFCAPLPSRWNMPLVTLSGSSSGSAPPVSLSGSLQFPSTDCGSAAPAAQSITLTNNTNQSFTYTLKLTSGAFYRLTDPNAGQLAAAGSAIIAVTPNQLTPGPGVQAGSAPYADNLLVSIAGPPAMSFNVPITWTLNGAVLSLPHVNGVPFVDPNGNGSFFYPADSTSGFPLPVLNTGTSAVSVAVAEQPLGVFTFVQPSPVQVIPGVQAFPQLMSTSSDAACLGNGGLDVNQATKSAVTFQYSGGPVCQPLPSSPPVKVYGCVGTF